MLLVSAGHHPSKPGACYKSFCEHDEAVRWVDEICDQLGEQRCVKVPPGVLRDKVRFINNRHPVAAVEIHFNSAVDSEGNHVGSGALCLHYPGSQTGMSLATRIQQGLEPIFGRHWNGVMEGWYRMDPKFGPDFFLARISCPSVIIEPEFIHHKELLQGNRYQACFAIAQSLLEFMR